MRVLLDTNVLVSALGTRGLCADLYRLVVVEHELIIGEVVLEELLRVLRLKFRVPPAGIVEVEELLRTHEVFERPNKPHEILVRDPDDAWILATARDARADVVITGDDDLLSLTDRLPFRILSPRAFWNEASKHGEESSR